jgi:hypothetical protein
MLKGFDSTHMHADITYLGFPCECSQPTNKCLHGIFNSENLNSNYRKLDAYYTQKLSLEELDERHLINSDNRLQTPLKLSPFARQGPMNKNIPPTPQKGDRDELEPPSKRMNSGRLLNYD